jgi:hypothetical protein
MDPRSEINMDGSVFDAVPGVVGVVKELFCPPRLALYSPYWATFGP